MKMDLTAVTDFNLVAKHGGFGAASRATATPKATLSRHVRELEERLGVRLIERGARPLRLTEEGAALHARTEEPFGTIADALQDIKAGLNRPSGRLRISAPLLFASTSLGPLAAAFLAAYPDVLLEVTTDDGFVDLRDGELDLVIRANPRPDDDLTATPCWPALARRWCRLPSSPAMCGPAAWCSGARRPCRLSKFGCCMRRDAWSAPK
jgi:DNA-binding transcriptional LysR family regulator